MKGLSLNVKQLTLEERWKKTYKRFAPWNEIDANNVIVDTMETGYKIPFISTAFISISKQSFSHNNHSDFVQDAINDLLPSGRIQNWNISLHWERLCW